MLLYTFCSLEPFAPQYIFLLNIFCFSEFCLLQIFLSSIRSTLIQNFNKIYGGPWEKNLILSLFSFHFKARVQPVSKRPKCSRKQSVPGSKGCKEQRVPESKGCQGAKGSMNQSVPGSKVLQRAKVTQGAKSSREQRVQRRKGFQGAKGSKEQKVLRSKVC